MPSTRPPRRLWPPEQTDDILIMNAKQPFASEPDTVVSVEYPAQQASVGLALSRLKDKNCCQGAGSELMSSLEIVLAEALNNVIEHACVGLDGRRFNLSCCFDGRAISIAIEDDGRPMPEFALPEGHAPTLAVHLDDLPEGGFGWFLIRSLCSEIRYVRRGSINRLELKLKSA